MARKKNIIYAIFPLFNAHMLKTVKLKSQQNRNKEYKVTFCKQTRVYS